MSLSALVVGYGRFGRALATLLNESGHTVYAVDPTAEVPTELALPSGGVGAVDIVVLCVPVVATDRVLSDLAPDLGPRHLVMDVASVRAPAEASMRRVLGSRVPWVGTHPLFGPSSLALGERPLQVVICPNDLHPDAAERARDFYTSIGCDVIEEDAAEHDRSMAYSHALAFFLAKGLLDIDATQRTRFVPPSFRSILRTVEAVRSDAGHLFYAIESLNPYSAEARSELLAALARLDDELLRATETASPEAEVFEIPDLGQAAPELRETRELIDDLDRRLLRIVAQRTELALRAGRAKSAHQLPVRDPARERAVLQDRKAWAAEEGLDEAPVGRLFEELMALARSVQDRAD